MRWRGIFSLSAMLLLGAVAGRIVGVTLHGIFETSLSSDHQIDPSVYALIGAAAMMAGASAAGSLRQGETNG